MYFCFHQLTFLLSFSFLLGVGVGEGWVGLPQAYAFCFSSAVLIASRAVQKDLCSFFIWHFVDGGSIWISGDLGERECTLFRLSLDFDERKVLSFFRTQYHVVNLQVLGGYFRVNTSGSPFPTPFCLFYFYFYFLSLLSFLSNFDFFDGG